MDLFTQHNFSIVRQLENPALTGPYYVQAVIRNAYSDALLATINLTDKTNQRFKGDWKIPADPSGEGFYVSIITSVYSDSGYTTKSTDYGDEENTYLVVDNPRTNKTGGGFSPSGGSGLIARDVRDIFKEELAKIVKDLKPEKPKDIKFPDQKEYDPRFDELLNAIKAIKMPEWKATDLSPIIKAIEALKSNIDGIDIPKLDLSPIISALKDNAENDDLTASELKDILGALEESLLKSIPKIVIDTIQGMNFITTSITHATDRSTNDKLKKEEKPEEELPKVDISKLGQ